MTADATPTVLTKILSAHLLAHVMMVSIAQILMNVQLVLITVTTTSQVKLILVDSLVDAMMDTRAMESIAHQSLRYYQ